MRLILAFAAVLGLAGAGAAAESERLEIKLPHKGQVFGEGPEWDRQFAREALQIFGDLKPDPAWVEKLKALPDNAWLKCSPAGDHRDGPGGRSETPMVYMPDFHAALFASGCGDPGYSSDTWIYHLGANRWVQMWPNFVKCSEAPKLNKEPYPGDRPGTRCSLGLAYDGDRKRVVMHGGANAGELGIVTWEYDPAANKWAQAAPAKAGPQRGADNCLGFAPGLGVVEVDGGTWVFRAATKSWQKLAIQGAQPDGKNSKLVWAARQKKLIFWAGTELWAFDPQALAWENISPKEGPSPAGFYRQGIDYDSANDVVIMYGSKDESGKMSMGPWVYSFEKKSWTDMKPANGPPRGSGQCLMTVYDPEYNVLLIACNGRGTWVYRYKRAAAPAKAGEK